jgi:hypothetical protein
MKVVYRHNYGNDSFGEVRKTKDNLYYCFTTPLFGGEWIEQEVFDDKEEAIEYINSLT